MIAKSIKGNSTEEIRIALSQCLTDGFKPTLAFVFISIKQDRKTVCEILHSEGIDIVGATSSGEFIHGEITPTVQSHVTGVRIDPAKSVIKIIQDLSKKDFPESEIRIDDNGLITYLGQ